MALNALRQTREAFVTLDRVIRLHFVFFTAVWPLMGAASARRDASAYQLAALVAVAICFHSFTYLVNDVIDLPIDRGDPRRQQDPIARGTLRPSVALLIAAVLPLVAAGITFSLGGGWQPQLTLAIGFASITAYNLWGKHCVFPPLTDVIQGVAWGSLAIYAAQALGAEPNVLTWLVAAYVGMFTLLFNGIHGPLRDLAADFNGGGRTTAILLGARPATPFGPAVVPLPVTVYAWLTLVGTIAISVAIMLRNDFNYAPESWTGVTIAVTLINVCIIRLQPKVARPYGAGWDVAYRLQLFLLMMALPLTFAAYASRQTWITFAALTALSLPFFGWTAAIVRWSLAVIRTPIAPLFRPKRAAGRIT